ncbi:hypothetical protein Ctob_001261 [Chrysochromulina tobinii]|uniref:EF-hand domain-containing protein n=1 Tax=Chrysochromulina tobinii TaxID=1460289 RepID=A0A0M0JCB7_9EUKA|nr:hypothetical protein Ctob_001261 [Chrysochromulina tobinii]|eukprot:KOO24241.1 hypothetical protein Ctob_001261 [Chrysochromulina sp. CCMP291]
MMKCRLFSVLAIVSLVDAAAARRLTGTQWFEPYVATLLSKTDGLTSALGGWTKPSTGSGNNNTKFENAGEWARMVWLLGIENDLIATYGSNGVAVAFDKADTSNDNGVTATEFTDYILACSAGVVGTPSPPAPPATCGPVSSEKAEQLGDKIIAEMTGVPDPTGMTAALSGIGSVPAHVTNARAILDISFTASQNPEDLFPVERDQIKNTIRNSLDPFLQMSLDHMTMTILSGSMVVDVTVFYTDDATANAAAALLQTDWSTAGFQQSLGVTTTSSLSISVSATIGSGTLDYVNIIIFACVCGALFCLACVIGSQCASRQYKEDMKKAGTMPSRGGCCSTGCCSVYASSGWALTTDCAAIFMLGGGFLLYTAMTDTQASIICIIDEIFELRDSESAQARSAIGGFESIFSLIDPIRPVLNLLNIFVAIPAALSALFMFLQSMCAYNAGKSWCSCCSKLFLLIAYVWIILSIIVGVIAAALGPLVQLEEAQSILSTSTGICETTLPTLEQTLQDATAAMARMPSNTTASSSSDLQNMLNAAQDPVAIFGNLCVCVTSFFGSAVNLFGPGICNIIVAIFAMYASCGQCWTEGCCVGPKTAKTTSITNGAKKMGKPIII